MSHRATRFFVDRKVDPETKEGGEHLRVIDVDVLELELDEAAARERAEKLLEPHELIGHVVTIVLTDQDYADGWEFS